MTAQVHLAVKHSGQSQVLKCTVCGIVCRSESEFSAHVRSAHASHIQAEEHPAPEEMEPEESAFPTSVLNLSLHCAYCGDTCQSRSELETHMKSHHQPADALPATGRDAGKVKCNICDQLCPSLSLLAEHKRSHYAKFQTRPGLPAELLYPCCFCNKQWPSQQLIANGMAPGGMQTYVCQDCLALPHHPHHPHPPRRYQCIKCQLVFSSEAEIQAHVTSHFMSEGSLDRCHICRKSFDTRLKLQQHLIEHTFAGYPAFTCYLCGSAFTGASGLQRHMFDVHGPSSRPYDCPHCHEKFFFRPELDNHIFSHVSSEFKPEQPRNPEAGKPEAGGSLAEGAEPVKEAKGAEEPTEPAKQPQPEENLCDTDNISVTSCSDESSEITLSDAQKAANAVPEDMLTVDDGHPEETRPPSAPAAPTQPTETEAAWLDTSGGKYRCEQCDKSFPCLSNLQGHVRIHTQGTRFTCPTCRKEFALSRNLHIHMRSPSGEKPYECPVCHKRFARKENRKAHLKLHSGVKPFTCPVCAKSFSRKCHLREHSRTHVDPVQRKSKTLQSPPLPS